MIILPPGKSSTLMVAASNATAQVKAQADYVCDGTADDVQIQAAIDALAASGPGGGIIHLSAGTFYISSTISPVASVSRGIIFRGEGMDATRLNQVGAITNMFYLPAGSPGNLFTTWEDMSLIGIHPTAGTGIRIEAVGPAKDIRLRRVFIQSFGTYGFYTDYSWGMMISDSVFEYSEVGLYFGGSLGLSFYSNKVLVNKSHGMVLASLYNSSIVGNEFQGNGLNTGGDQLRLESSYLNKILGNKFTGDTGTGAGLYLTGSSWGNTISNNVFEGNVGNDLVLNGSGATRNIITSNTMRSPIGSVSMSSTTQYNYIANNRMVANVAVTGPIYTGYHRNRWFEGKVDDFSNVLAANNTYVVNGEDLTQATPITATLANQPDVPRAVRMEIVDADASISAWNIEISGVNARGQDDKEVWTSSKIRTGNVAWSRITSIIVTSITGANAGDVMNIGITIRLGLSDHVYATADVYKIRQNGADVAPVGGSVSTDYGTYTMAAIVGGDDIVIYFRRNLNIIAPD